LAQLRMAPLNYRTEQLFTKVQSHPKILSKLQSPKLSTPHDTWGISNFKKLPRTKAIVRVFSFLITVLSISYLSMVFNCKNFALDILTKVDCLIAFILLYSEGVNVKQWLIDRFTWPKSKKPILVGLFLVTMPVVFAAIGHRLLVGQFPVIEQMPFSGHVFGYFLMNLFLVVFEDISWRAFLLPRVLFLQSYFISIVAIGFLWGAWHIPFHLNLNLIAPDQMMTQILYYTCVFLIYYVVWTLSEGSIIPLIITHAFYNTLGHFTVENILFLEGYSDGWSFYYFQTIALGIFACVAAMYLKHSKKNFHLD